MPRALAISVLVAVTVPLLLAASVMVIDAPRVAQPSGLNRQARDRR